LNYLESIVGKKYLVVGATGAIGADVCKALIDNGANVVAIGRNKDKLSSLKNLSDSILTYEFDLSDLDNLNKNFEEILSINTPFSGLVICSGINKVMPYSTYSVKSISELMNINFVSNMLMVKSFVKKKFLAESNVSIVAISSIMAEVSEKGASIYSSSKSALDCAIRGLSQELAKDKVRINTIQSGHIATELLTNNKHISQEYLQSLNDKYPLGLGEVADISNAVLFLLSENSKWITGTNLRIDGGASTKF